MAEKRPTTISTSFLTFDAFFKQFPFKVFKKRTPIINADTLTNDIFYIKKGYARAYGVSPSGQELTMVIFQPGDFFPLISTIRPQKIDYYIESLTEIEVIAVPRNQFIVFLQGRPDLTQDLTMRITERFEGALKRMEYLVFGTAAQRLISIILILGERFGLVTQGNIFVNAPLTHRDLASLVGITRETTTLILRDLVKKSYIEFRNRHIVIKNLRALKREVDR